MLENCENFLFSRDQVTLLFEERDRAQFILG
jgi:hypothetical protein